MHVLDDLPSLDPFSLLRWLDSEEACRQLSRSMRRKLRRLLRKQDERLKTHVHGARVALLPFVCSSPWADVVFCFLASEGLLSRSASVNAATARNRGVYPPRTERPDTGMLVCRGCGRPTPRHCVGSSGHCDDCRYADLESRGLHVPRGSSTVVSMRDRRDLYLRH